MSYLLDTDWVIDLLRGVERVSRRLEELASEGLALSIISLAELYEGVYYSRDPLKSEEVLKRFLAPELIFSGLMRRPARYSAESEADCGKRVEA